jgi:hypothetical protein
MEHKKWQCPKCGNKQFETGRFQATGGTLSKIFDVQNQKFTTVTCTRCQFTEIYKSDTKTIHNFLDFITS